MASISFEVLNNSNVGSGLNGSGLGFYGDGGFGTSVPLFNYQGSTYVTSSDGTVQGPTAINIKYLSPESGYINVGPNSGILSRINSADSTLVIHFTHDAAIKVQNAQLRIYDRDNINNPATGVITKVAEIVNFAGKTYNDWLSNAGAVINGDTYASGLGDAFWWGAPWPKASCNTEVSSDSTDTVRPRYVNSVGVNFYNFTDAQAAGNSGNLHPRVSGLNTPGNLTVGGSGIIVPLLDSPGSGGRLMISGTNPPLPKYCQYINSTAQTATSVQAQTGYASGVGNINRMQGGSGADLRHTWRVALSAAPLNIGSKTQFGLYLSLEYL